MAPNRIRENAVTLVAAAFFMPSVRKFLLPLPCYLLVAYRYPTHQILPHSRACHTQFPFSLLNMKKVPQPLEITVLSSLPAFSIHKVYLELTSLGSFLNRNSNTPKISPNRHFCYLRVSYSANFLTCERFPRLIYANSTLQLRHTHSRSLPRILWAICNNHTENCPPS